MTKGLALGVTLMLTAATTAGAQQQRPAATEKHQAQIRLLEGVLVQAVRNGAGEVAKELRRLQPAEMTVLLGTPRARGFPLEGYGVFFDVEIPALNQSAVWAVLTIQRDRQIMTALNMMASALAAMPAGPTRQQAETAFKRVAQTVGPSEQITSTQPPPNAVAAANVVPDADATAKAPDLYDPLAHYTKAVQAALIDAMLDHSLRMELGPDEWLTVAARDSAGPLAPGGLNDAMTVILRVKGSDLAAYQADPKKRDEIRAKVNADARWF